MNELNYEFLSNMINGFTFKNNTVIKCDSGKDIVNIPDGVDAIESNAFSWITLREVTFPNSVMKIADDAFNNCPNVKIVHWPESFSERNKIEIYKNLVCNKNKIAENELIRIADSSSDATLSFEIYKFLCDHNCKRLFMKVGELYTEGKGTEQNYEKAILYYNKVSDEGKIEAQQRIIRLKELIASQEIKKESYINDNSITDFEIPEGVKIIKQHCFNNCENLVSIKFPSSLKEINRKSFNYCSAITEIVFPKELVFIGDNCFKDCTNLKHIEFNSIPSIGDNCFFNCNNLDDISRKSLESIQGQSTEKEKPENKLLTERVKKSDDIPIKLENEILNKLNCNQLSDEEYLWLYRMGYSEEVSKKYPLYLPLKYNSSIISSFISSLDYKNLNTTEIIQFIEQYLNKKIESIKNALSIIFLRSSDTFTVIKDDLYLDQFEKLSKVIQINDLASSQKFRTLIKKGMEESGKTKEDYEDVMKRIYQFVEKTLNIKSDQKTILYKFQDETNFSHDEWDERYDVFEFAEIYERYLTCGKQVVFSIEIIDRVNNKKILSNYFGM